LDGIPGQFAISENPLGQHPRRFDVMGHELTKRGLVTAPRSIDQLDVGAPVPSTHIAHTYSVANGAQG
jgi:hypothetical protein